MSGFGSTGFGGSGFGAPPPFGSPLRQQQQQQQQQQGPPFGNSFGSVQANNAPLSTTTPAPFGSPATSATTTFGTVPSSTMSFGSSPNVMTTGFGQTQQQQQQQQHPLYIYFGI